jgi:hypothetical protein
VHETCAYISGEAGESHVQEDHKAQERLQLKRRSSEETLAVGRDAAETERFFISIHAAGNADRKKQKKKKNQEKERRDETKDECGKEKRKCLFDFLKELDRPQRSRLS